MEELFYSKNCLKLADTISISQENYNCISERSKLLLARFNKLKQEDAFNLKLYFRYHITTPGDFIKRLSSDNPEISWVCSEITYSALSRKKLKISTNDLNSLISESLDLLDISEENILEEYDSLIKRVKKLIKELYNLSS